SCVPLRWRRPLPRRRGAPLRRSALPRRHSYRSLDRVRAPRILQQQEHGHRHLAHRRLQSERRARDRVQAHQSCQQAERRVSYMTEERRLIQETAREFAMREVLPLANKLDPEQGEIPMSLRDQLAEMGYFGIVIPEQYGGPGLGVFEYCLITEELARAWMSVASILARGNGLIGSRPMNEGQKRLYLTRMAKGAVVGPFSLA